MKATPTTKSLLPSHLVEAALPHVVRYLEAEDKYRLYQTSTSCRRALFNGQTLYSLEPFTPQTLSARKIVSTGFRRSDAFILCRDLRNFSVPIDTFGRGIQRFYRELLFKLGCSIPASNEDTRAISFKNFWINIVKCSPPKAPFALECFKTLVSTVIFPKDIAVDPSGRGLCSCAVELFGQFNNKDFPNLKTIIFSIPQGIYCGALGSYGLIFPRSGEDLDILAINPSIETVHIPLAERFETKKQEMTEVLHKKFPRAKLIFEDPSDYPYK